MSIGDLWRYIAEWMLTGVYMSINGCCGMYLGSLSSFGRVLLPTFELTSWKPCMTLAVHHLSTLPHAWQVHLGFFEDAHVTTYRVLQCCCVPCSCWIYWRRCC